MNKEEDFDKEYFLATKDNRKEFVVYTSEGYKFSELDLLNLIKICVVDKRSKTLGRKILAVYEDSTKEREEFTRQRLKNLGLYNDDGKQTRRKNIKNR